MKLQLLEAYSGGHYTRYVESILPALERLVAEAVVDEIVVSITKHSFSLLQQAGVQINAKAAIRFDPCLDEAAPPITWENKFKLFRAYQKAVQIEKPDVVLRITADYDLVFNALFNLFLDVSRKNPTPLGCFTMEKR